MFTKYNFFIHIEKQRFMDYEDKYPNWSLESLPLSELDFSVVSNSESRSDPKLSESDSEDTDGSFSQITSKHLPQQPILHLSRFVEEVQ